MYEKARAKLLPCQSKPIVFFFFFFFCRSHYRRRCRCSTSLFVLFQDAVLVTGRSRLVVVSLKDGSLLASHTIPCEPLSPVAHGDFTNDGLMDFVVHCRASYLGFSLDSRPGFWWTAVWVACGLGAIGIAVLILRFIEEVIA